MSTQCDIEFDKELTIEFLIILFEYDITDSVREQLEILLCYGITIEEISVIKKTFGEEIIELDDNSDKIFSPLSKAYLIALLFTAITKQHLNKFKIFEHVITDFQLSISELIFWNCCSKLLLKTNCVDDLTKKLIQITLQCSETCD